MSDRNEHLREVLVEGGVDAQLKLLHLEMAAFAKLYLRVSILLDIRLDADNAVSRECIDAAGRANAHNHPDEGTIQFIRKAFHLDDLEPKGNDGH